MIERVSIEGFKSLENVALSLGHLNLFIGTNASGKSNLFDALRLLQGIGHGLTVDQVLNGKPGSASGEAWEPIRGGSARALFLPRGRQELPPPDPVMTFRVQFRAPEERPPLQYELGISPLLGAVRREKLQTGRSVIYDSSPIHNPPESPVLEVRYYARKPGKPAQKKFEKSRPVLHQILREKILRPDDAGSVEACVAALSNMQRLDPSPAVLRDYSRAPFVRRMGERGENFAALVATICREGPLRSEYVSWLRRLTPRELDEVATLPGALGEPMFALRDGTAKRPAPILSDGTLRFCAIAAAFFQPDLPDILTVEELENALHPSRLRILLELLKNRSRQGRVQVMATTHSPIVLAWLDEEDYPHTFFCKLDEETGATRICPLSEIPAFLELVRRQPIGDLFSEGWLEGAL